MKTALSKYDNNCYQSGNNVKTAFWYLTNVLCFINPLNPFSGLKVAFLRLYGAKIGNGVLIKSGVNIKYPCKLEIGDHCWIGGQVWIDNVAHVILKNNVCISQGAFLVCGNHNYKNQVSI
jgi:putative colanic acid biosynthesis acetyltransferase WcaF